MNMILTNYLSNIWGLDFGLSAKTALVAWSSTVMNYFFKEELYKPMNEMKGSLADEFY
jgi:hypothetical protein